jgi:transposase
MRAIKMPAQSAEEMQGLEKLYHTAKNARLQQRVQMILLAAEKQMLADEIAEIVRRDEQTVRRWLKRYLSKGIEGLQDDPRPGCQVIVTPQYLEKLVATVRRRPRSPGQPYSMWTCQRLADYLAEETGLRLSDETVRRYLAEAGIVLSRPQHKISSPDPEYEVKKRRLKKRGIL